LNALVFHIEHLLLSQWLYASLPALINALDLRKHFRRIIFDAKVADNLLKNRMRFAKNWW